MFGQSFAASDIGVISALIVLEGLLSADNALVLAIMVRHLKAEEQKKALLYGLGGAFVLRTLVIALAAVISQMWWVQALGALYLIYLPVKHFTEHRKATSGAGKERKRAGFWMTVLQVEIMDIAFALDSVLAGIAMVNTAKNPDKLWVVIAGGVIGLVILRFAAGAFLRILRQYPLLDHVAYLLVGWAGIKMLFVTGHTFEVWWGKTNPGTPPPVHIGEMSPPVFWTGMLLIAVVGTFLALRNGPETIDSEEADLIESVEETSDLNIDNDSNEEPVK